MAKRIYDLAVKVGTYEKNGETKGRYKNCGCMMEKDDGGKFLMIDPTFNFAAIKRDEGRDMVLVSMFEPKDNKQSSSTQEEE